MKVLHFAALAASLVLLGKAALAHPKAPVEVPKSSHQHTFDVDSLANGDYFPIQVKRPWWEEHSDNVDHSSSTPRTRKVAIIGGGAGGSSAAYFLYRAHEKLRQDFGGSDAIQATLFERDERIGGRAAVVHPYHNETYPSVEMGASLFAHVNLNMRRAAMQFNLSTSNEMLGDGSMALWDGQQFILESIGGSWWQSAKLLWRYGYSPKTAMDMIKPLVSRFKDIYDPEKMHKADGDAKPSMGYPWATIPEAVDALHARHVVDTTGEDYFTKGGVSKLFVDEIMEGATLTNYGQEVGAIHGIGASICMAIAGAAGVKGGNFQVFENLIRESKQTRLRMGVHGEVTGLARFRTAAEAIEVGKLSEDDVRVQQWRNSNAGTSSHHVSNAKWWLGTKSGYGDFFDAVFIAAPWHSSGVTLLNTNRVIPTVDFKHLHVTILTTSAAQPNPAYFGRGEKDVISRTIITSHVTKNKRAEGERKKKGLFSMSKSLSKSGKSHKGAKKGGTHDLSRQTSSVNMWPWGGGGGDGEKPLRLDFHSLTYLREIESPTGEKEWIVRLHSDEELGDAQLDDLFGQGNVKWIKRQAWDAYPLLKPTTTFPPIEADDNLYYLNAMEPFVSTMETTTISARNAVALWLEREYGSDFVHGGKDCPWDKKEQSVKPQRSGLMSKLKFRLRGKCFFCQLSADSVDDWASWGCKGA